MQLILDNSLNTVLVLPTAQRVATGSSTVVTVMARNIDQIGTNIYKRMDGSWVKAVTASSRFVERIGELGGGVVAKKLGLTRVEGFVKRVHSFDGVFQKGNIFFVLEAKGGTGHLAKGQMSRKWIKDNIRKLPSGHLKKQLEDALNDGRLYGIVTTTRISKTENVIEDTEWAMKHFGQIGPTTWRN